MNNWQLSCGHWVTDADLNSIGQPYPCKRCDSLRTTVIGYAATFPSLVGRPA